MSMMTQVMIGALTTRIERYQAAIRALQACEGEEEAVPVPVPRARDNGKGSPMAKGKARRTIERQRRFDLV